MSKFTGRLFVLYEGREQAGDAAGVENAPILATAISEPKARELGHWFRDALWWEYEVSQGQITGGIPRWDIWVCRGLLNLRKAK